MSKKKRKQPAKKRAKALVLNGPNMNLLGRREPEFYGSATLKDLEDMCRSAGAAFGLAVDCKQSNHEGELITWIQEARDAYDGIVINAGAYTHTSIAILDALRFAELPVFEVHITNTAARESYRHHSFISSVAVGVISGFGVEGYAFALRGLATLLEEIHNYKP